MYSVKSRISDIEEFQREREALKKKQESILSSRISKEEEIRKIYELIKSICKNDNNISSLYTPKDYFILITLILYSPRVFAGNVLERGKRNAIARTLNLSPTRITHSLRTVRSWYKYYNDFQFSVDYIYGFVIGELNEESKEA